MALWNKGREVRPLFAGAYDAMNTITFHADESLLPPHGYLLYPVVA